MAIDDGKLTLELQMNTEKAEKALKEMHNKIENMKKSSAGGSFGQQTGGNNQQNDLKIKRLEDIRRRENKKDRELIYKDLRKQQEALDKHMKSYNEMTGQMKELKKYSKEWYDISEKQTEVFATMSKHIDAIAAGKKAISQQDAADRQRALSQGGGGGIGGGGIGGGGTGGGGRGGGMFSKMMGRMSVPALLGLLQSGASIGADMITNPEAVTRARATSAERLGEGVNLMENRKMYEYNLYGRERMEAMEAGRRKMESIRFGDNAQALAGAGTMAAGAGVMAAGGGLALAGAPIAGVGAAPGLGIMAKGALTVGAGALTTGSMLFNDRKRDYLLSHLGDEEAGANYEKKVFAEGAKARKEALKNLKKERILTGAAERYFEGNRGNFLGIQRQFGMSDQDLFEGEGSLLNQGAAAGFREQDMMQAMRGISAAGGTTGSAKSSAILANQLQRNANLTNAPQLIGMLSGGAGMDTEQSKDAIIRMIAEATRLGLDTSETREFLQTTSQLAYQTGSGVGITGGMLAAGTEMDTKRGIKAAEDAYQNLRNKTGKGGGKLKMQYELAGLRDMTLNGQALGLGTSSLLVSLPADQLTMDNPLMKGLMKKFGLNPDDPKDQEKIEEFLTKARQNKGGSTTLQDAELEALKKRDVAKERLENIDKQIEEEKKKPKDQQKMDKLNKLRKKAKDEFDIANVESSMERAKTGNLQHMDKFKEEAEKGMLGDLVRTGAKFKDLTPEEKKAREQVEKKSGRMGDLRISEEAQAAAGMLKILTTEAGKLRIAFAQTTKELVIAATELAGLQALQKTTENEEQQKQLQKEIEAKEMRLDQIAAGVDSADKSSYVLSRPLQDAMNKPVDTGNYSVPDRTNYVTKD
jgi:hypothetical protein